MRKIPHKRARYCVFSQAYAGLLDGKRASTHWMAEQDFRQRFPRIKLDMNALYVDEDKPITSAGTGASLDCCLYRYRFHGLKRLGRLRVLSAPVRPGGRHAVCSAKVARMIPMQRKFFRPRGAWHQRHVRRGPFVSNTAVALLLCF